MSRLLDVSQSDYQLRHLLGGVAWIGASGLVGRFAGFGASIAVAHALGPRSFGLLAVGLALASMASLCAGLGLDEILVRDIARNAAATPGENTSGTLFGDILLVRLACVPICVIGAVALAAASHADVWLVLGLALYAILNTFLVSGCAAFRGHGKMRVQALLVGTQTVLIAVGAVGVSFVTERLDLVVVAYVAPTAVCVVAAHVLLQRTPVRPHFAWRPVSWLRLVRRAVPFATASVGLLALDRAALVCITLVSGPAAAGWFGAGHTIVLALAGLATSAMMVAFPMLVRAAAHDYRRFASLVSELVCVALLGGGILAVAIYALAPFGVPILFGAEYTPSIDVVRAIAFSLPGLFVSLALVGALEASDRQSVSAQAIAVAVPLALVICLVGTCTWGVTGGAVAYSASHVALAGLVVIRWTRWQPASHAAVLRPS